MVPHPTVMSRNVELHAGKIRKCLAVEIKRVMDEKVSVAFTTDMKAEDYIKISHYDLASYCADLEWNLWDLKMGCNDSTQGE